MTITTRLTRLLGVTHPVMLAAMDVVADARLTLAVSEAGGFGILGGGYGDAGWLEAELPVLVAGRASSGLRFGIGFITWSLAKQPHLLDIALDAKPDAVWLSFGDPEPFAGRIKAAGALVICQIQSVAMARDAVAKGADIVVAQGAEAGGHGASRGTFALVPAVADAVGDKAVVVAAGGVAEGRGLAAALMLGAEGVVVGTRLYASLEAAGHGAAKERIVAASGDDTVRGLVFDISRQNVWPAPFTGRCLVNDHSRRWTGREVELMQNVASEMPRYLAARAAGDFDTAAVIAGESVALVHDIAPAGVIVREMVEKAEALLAVGQGGSVRVGA
ncbi:NAD(P)H-dependent flavin oxidoreductase [Bosea sp. PAMC 26642]|uniref:NAD(P)H-dependent flavin oxidoreductase n=1 Tax=Bosea sp. (strain PAMC 26642) TaxID=1792307 RepID=UPI000770505A|nr:nitronate monooxygenase [Bosea sp. PAMC 26642]AMJ61196.1 2-nitropropane dioxygenase [Bosea sp. PAMC 26642]